jgi:neutral ceramidase
MQAELLAGAASVIVTPDLGCPLAGFDARKGVAEKVHDDLFARTLVLDDGTTQVALVSVEVLGVSKPFAYRVRAEVERRTGIPATNVILSATHTHCAPVTLNHFFNQGQPLDETYLDRLASRIVSSVVSANEARKPRRLRTGFVTVEGVAVNRRTEDGLPVDNSAGVLLVEELDGTPAAVSIFYPCHTTTLGPNTLEITADFPYYTIQNLKQKLGSPTEILYFNGAEGDLSVGHKSDLSAVGIIAPNRTFERAKELGDKLAVAVSAGLAGLHPETGKLRVESTQAPLPLKRYAPISEMKRQREQAGQRMNEAENQGLPNREKILAKQASLFSRIEEYYALLSEGLPEPMRLEAELTAIRIGETALLSLPGEVFVGISLNIRGRSPFVKTMFLGLANDYIGYVPTKEANASLGYEVVASRVTPEADAILTDAAIGLLEQLDRQ